MTTKKKTMYTIVLKEKDENNQHLSIDCEIFLPTYIGDTTKGTDIKVILAPVDDQAFFIFPENIWYIEQNRGAKLDQEMAQKMAFEVIQKRREEKQKSESEIYN